jgi:hypothetical protein
LNFLLAAERFVGIDIGAVSGLFQRNIVPAENSDGLLLVNRKRRLRLQRYMFKV